MSINFSLIAILFLLIVAVGMVAGILILQIFLSKKESKWLGIILPVITFCFSTIIILGITSYMVLPETNQITEKMTIIDETTGAVEYDETIDDIGYDDKVNTEYMVKENRTTTMSLLMGFLGFLILNIPTIILLVIYIIYRKKINQNSALEKMSVQDLE